MAKVQSLDKPKSLRGCFDVPDHFAYRIFEKYDDSDEVRLIFDRYDLSTINN